MTTQRLSLERPSPFRRRQFVVPHRRRSRALLLLRPFVAALILVGLPVTATVWVTTSPLFLLAEIRIGPTESVSTEEVALALAGLEGQHLMVLSLADVENLLASNPWIEGAAIRKELPNRLMVEVHERSPVALLRQEEGLFYVDKTGFVMEPYDPAGPVDLPLLSLAPGAALDVTRALEVATRFDQFVPFGTVGLSEIELLGLDDFRIHSAELAFPVLVSGTELEMQLVKLEELLPEITRRFPAVEAVDLRFSRQIVVQPAVEPRSQEGRG